MTADASGRQLGVVADVVAESRREALKLPRGSG
jgi:hypothetical protein